MGPSEAYGASAAPATKTETSGMTDLDPAAASGPAVIDLVHLARQTHGDRALELELLALFERQCGRAASRLRDPALHGARKAQADLAHTLRGSALAIGAQRVALAADLFEQAMAKGGEPAECETQLAQLEAALLLARSAVRELLAA